MGKDKFKKGLEDMGLDVEERDGQWVIVKAYTIQSGRFKDKLIDIAFEVPADFELTEPHGPHVRPLLFPVNTSTKDPKERMHNSPLGDDWGHLSRPFPKWKEGQRTVKRYMEYIKYLFEETL